MTTPVDVTVLLRYLTGESTEDESRFVQSWCRSSAANAAWLEALRCGGDEGVARFQVDIIRGMERLRNRVDDVLAPEVQQRIGRKRETVHIPTWQRGVFKGQPLRQALWSPITGLILGTALLILGWRFGSAGALRKTPAAKYTTYTTAAGQRATITLPDGNTVALNVASRLEVPTNYGTSNHVVRLTVGEALFTVLHHDGAPFAVVSGTATVRVLGTNFLVRHYTTDTTVTVAVQEGKVVVGNTVVVPRRLVELERNGALREHTVDPGQFAFATGVLMLPQMRLSQAIPELERWYNGEIRLADPVFGDNVIAGRIPAGSLADLADVLSVITGGRVVRDGRILTLYKRTGS